ncbi:zinc ribbon domain-containing protein [Mangrovimonas aestuarii]|uniref:hypothetical protein n=1 Tax=Mangrovimonas aestuarii TaxID=3018443 RepID=UPI0023795A6B|nr:hypothetical protein [Mangrovimonas aestuarii]
MKLNKLKTFFLAVLAVTCLVSCGDDDITTTASFVSFERPSYDVDLLDGESMTMDVNVYINDKSSSDRTFNVVVKPESSVDEGLYSFDGTVTIPANSTMGTFSLTVDTADVEETSDSQTLILGFGNDDDVYTSDTTTVNIGITVSCEFTQVYLDLVFDDYGSETSWEIYTEANTETPLLSGGGYADGDVSDSIELCLEDGNYFLVIYDAYGDGMCCNYGQGSYTLRLADDTVLVQGGEFGQNDVQAFTIGG